MSSQLSSTITDGKRKQLDFLYDEQGRRVSKVVASWNGSSYVPQSTNRFVYDGWNLMAVLGSMNELSLSFSWGKDLSGTEQGAGGIGGLVSMTVHSGAEAGTYFYAYDGNGNVVALVKSDGTISARYEYGPFGETIRASGSLAEINPFRWSTKFTDIETDLVFYGYRYYNPSLGRWLNRDPIEEEGGLNLYAFVGNNAANSIDALGLTTLGEEGAVAGIAGTVGGGSAAAAGSIKAMAAWTVFEVSMSAYDLYDAIDTITDPEADISDKVFSAGGFALGIVAPGGGYGKISKGTRKVLHQYQSKFKHAEAFGIMGPYNMENALKFRQAVSAHRKNPATQQILGTYKKNPVIFFTDPGTGLTTIHSSSGQFISGWKLNAEQLENVLTRGSL
ncbi:MAG: RHS repeat-associated core domain-containing protein [Verrucomicrobiales bacterium]